MSIIEDHGEERISTESLIKIVKEYVPLELLKCSDYKKLQPAVLQYVQDDGEKFLQKLLDISNHQLRIYGSGQELAENLKIYRGFQNNMQFFNMDISNPYSVSPKIYESVSNKKYVCKQDIFVHIQDLILENYPLLNSHLPNFMLLIFLKNHEERLKDCIEFIQYTDEEFKIFKAEFDEMKGNLSDTTKNHFPLAPKYTLYLNEYSFEELYNQFKTLLPFKWDENKYQVVKIILKSLFDLYDPKKDPLRYKHLYYNIGVMIDHLQKVMKGRPKWFLPDSNDRDGQIKLRLFEDNDEQFVMFGDFSKNVIKYFKIDQYTFGTVSHSQLQQLDPEQMEKIEKIYFVGMSTVKKIDRKCAELFLHYVTSNKPPAIDVRNAKSDGFTLNNLINELKHLGLNEAFPTITNYAELVYDHVKKTSKNKILKTTDLFDAIELCQLICIFKKLPKLANLLHSQKACHRILNKCDICFPPPPEQLREGREDNYHHVRENLAKFGKADFLFDGATVNVRAWDPSKTFEENTQCNTCDEYHSSCNKSHAPRKPDVPQTNAKSSTSELSKTEKETESYIEKLAAAEAEIARLKTEMDTKKKEHARLAEEHEKKRQQEWKQLNEELEEANRRVIEQQKCKESENNIATSKDELQDINSQLTKKIADEKKRNLEAEGDVNKLKEEVRAAKEQLDTTSQELDRLKAAGQDIRRLQEENESLERRLEEKDKVMDDILNKLVEKK
ncbi:hypothetical protein CAEBREN_09743 [Caenorhabditis brenneri]|uniref:DUF7809 domain-containing protein n=1 Tax=Caenorhabditis brenneri TaxID=135651 RepID=G0MS74_CAEBE|nr:hypothetical protein CAEBREN_09743 [Caenorhabditis brenneri]